MGVLFLFICFLCLFVCFSFFCKMFIIFYSVSARLWNLNLFLGLPCSRAEDNFITGNVHCVLFDSSLSRTQWLNFYKLSFVAQSVLRQLENNSLGNKFFLSHLFSSPWEPINYFSSCLNIALLVSSSVWMCKNTWSHFCFRKTLSSTTCLLDGSSLH